MLSTPFVVGLYVFAVGTIWLTFRIEYETPTVLCLGVAGGAATLGCGIAYAGALIGLGTFLELSGYTGSGLLVLGLLGALVGA